MVVVVVVVVVIVVVVIVVVGVFALYKFHFVLAIHCDFAASLVSTICAVDCLK